MKRALIVVVVLFALPLLAIGGWYQMHSRESASQADQYEAWAKNQKPVPVEFVVTAPPETPADQILYLSGNDAALGAWDGAGVPLSKGADGKYHGTVDLLSGI